MSGKRVNLVREMADLADGLRRPPQLIDDPIERQAVLEWLVHVRHLLRGSAAFEAWLPKQVPYPTPDHDMAEVEIRCRRLRVYGLLATDNDGARELFYERVAAWVRARIAAGIAPEHAIRERP